MKTVLSLVGLLFIVLLLGLLSKVKEGFGYSMGTMIQLQTSHVPGSVEEMEEEEQAYLRQVQHDLIDMTGSGL
jgi:hypothetical protein